MHALGPSHVLILVLMLQAAEAIILNVKTFDKGRFAISSIYHPTLAALYKQLAIKPAWHPVQKLWAFKDEVYPELMQKLLDVNFAGKDPLRAPAVLIILCSMILQA